jgi:hypothetical protein
MNVTLKTGILIGVSCAAWTYVMGFTGWYKHPVLLNVFFVVVLIEVGLLIWGLRQTAAAGKKYGGQVLTGTLMSVIAAPILMANSFLFTTVVIPSYFSDLRAMHTEILRAAGKTPAEVAALVEAAAQNETPLMQAISGAVGTVGTGLVASLIIGAFYRSRS